MRIPHLFALLALLLASCATTVDTPPAGTPAGGQAAVQGSGGVNAPEHRGKPRVILVSLDGFRWDYQDLVDTPNLDRVASRGVRADALIPVFPTKTFPNHYTIATGMYPENHGIVGNSFYDPARDATYSIGDRESVMDGTWYRGEPIWVTAETQGMVAASFFWVGSEADVMGVQPTIWTPYDGRIPNEARVDSVIAWLEMPAETSPHVITLYFSNVDSAGHRHGPDSEEVVQAIRDTDLVIGRLLDGIDGLASGDEVYLVIVSDHGMANYTTETAVAIDELIDMTGVSMADSGPAANLHVEGGAARAREVRDQLNARLANGHAYLRQDVPEHLNYRADPRIGDVVVVMEEGWQIRSSDRMPRSAGGSHGWDPTLESMHGIFLAMGPGIRQGARIEAFEAIHVYPLLVEVLGLRPGPDVDGTPGWLRTQLTGR